MDVSFEPAAESIDGATGVSAADVLRLNAPLPSLAAIASLVGLGVAAVAPLHSRLRTLAAAGGLLAAYMLVASAAATYLVFDRSRVTRYAWLRDRLGLDPGSWLNITTGFDDTTGTLTRLWPSSKFLAIDVYDPSAPHEAALTRARTLRPPAGLTLLPEQPLPLPDAAADVALLLMAAHEVRGPEDRAALFLEVARVLGQSGTLVVVEHVRDVANALAFGPGALHFYPATTWKEAGRTAGMALTQELRLTPFVRAFVFRVAS